MRSFISIVFMMGSFLLVSCGNSDKGDNTWSDGLQNITEWEQIDRMGNPLVNVVLIDDATDKDDFNFFDPTDDLTNFKTVFETKVTKLRSDVSTVWGTATGTVSVAAFTAMVLPDVLTIDLAKDTTYPNGRALADDAADLF